MFMRGSLSSCRPQRGGAPTVAIAYKTTTLVSKLMKVKSDQDSIQTVSQWCLLYGKHHMQTVATWAAQFNVQVQNRLKLLYAASGLPKTRPAQTLPAGQLSRLASARNRAL